MQISPANISLFFTSLNTLFNNGLSVAQPWSQTLAMTMPSNSDTEAYGWIGMQEKMREWTGSRVVHTPAPQTYLVKNQLFEQTQGLDKFVLSDDRHGLYLPMAQGMGMQAKKWPDYQVRDLLENSGSQTGTRQTGPDGVTFWGTNHPIDFYNSGAGTYVNDLGVSGTSINSITVGGALAPSAYSTAWQEFANRKSESGERLGIRPNLLMVPAQLDFTAKTLLQAAYFSPNSFQASPGTLVGPSDNVLRGSSDILMNGDLTSMAAWYLFDTSKPMKPVVFQLREAPAWVQRIVPTDPVVFDTHHFLFGVEARGAPAWGPAWLSMRSGV